METVTTHAEVPRRLYPRVLAKTLGLTRSLPDAEVGRLEEARVALQLAIEPARNAHERDQIHARLRKLDGVKDHDH